MNRRVGGGRTLLAMLVLTGGLIGAASAQDQDPAQDPAQPPLPPLRPAISLLLVSEPIMTVNYTGDFGPMQVTGTLVQSPETPLRTIGPDGEPRDVRWTELSGVRLVRTPTAELPAGSFVLLLSGDPGALVRSSAVQPGGYAEATAAALLSPVLRRLPRLPGGELVLRGDPYETMRVPVERILNARQEPVRGSLDAPIAGELALEVGRVNGTGTKVVNIPMARVETLRRDVSRGLATVTLGDQQIFSGRVVSLPEVAIQVDVEGAALALAPQGTTKLSIPLSRVAQLETTTPLVTRTLGNP